MEVLWTGFGSLLKGDLRMTSRTSVWMFFIYGLAGLLSPVIDYILRYPVAVRGGIYVVFIFAAEFMTGYVMTKLNVCPWDYSDAKYNVMGIIRLDYAPAWFAAGLLLEFAHTRLNGLI